MCASRGFNLTKWKSNSRELLAFLPDNKRAKEVRAVDLGKNVPPVEIALRVLCFIESDSFRFRIIEEGF